MPEEQNRQAQLNQSRNQDAAASGAGEPASPESETGEPENKAASASASPEQGGMPAIAMLFVALLFDLIGIIPIINLATELLAGFIFWWWQKSYLPDKNPLVSLLVNKVVDFISLGLWPSNTAFVMTAVIQKWAGTMLKSSLIRKVATRALSGGAV